MQGKVFQKDFKLNLLEYMARTGLYTSLQDELPGEFYTSQNIPLPVPFDYRKARVQLLDSLQKNNPPKYITSDPVTRGHWQKVAELIRRNPTVYKRRSYVPPPAYCPINRPKPRQEENLMEGPKRVEAPEKAAGVIENHRKSIGNPHPMPTVAPSVPPVQPPHFVRYGKDPTMQAVHPVARPVHFPPEVPIKTTTAGVIETHGKPMRNPHLMSTVAPSVPPIQPPHAGVIENHSRPMGNPHLVPTVPPSVPPTQPPKPMGNPYPMPTVPPSVSPVQPRHPMGNPHLMPTVPPSVPPDQPRHPMGNPHLMSTVAPSVPPVQPPHLVRYGKDPTMQAVNPFGRRVHFAPEVPIKTTTAEVIENHSKPMGNPHLKSTVPPSLPPVQPPHLARYGKDPTMQAVNPVARPVHFPPEVPIKTTYKMVKKEVEGSIPSANKDGTVSDGTSTASVIKPPGDVCTDDQVITIDDEEPPTGTLLVGGKKEGFFEKTDGLDVVETFVGNLLAQLNILEGENSTLKREQEQRDEKLRHLAERGKQDAGRIAHLVAENAAQVATMKGLEAELTGKKALEVKEELREKLRAMDEELKETRERNRRLKRTFMEKRLCHSLAMKALEEVKDLFQFDEEAREEAIADYAFALDKVAAEE